MEEEGIVITEEKPITFSQTTDSAEGQEIQMVILTLKESEQIVEFN